MRITGKASSRAVCLLGLAGTVLVPATALGDPSSGLLPLTTSYEARIEYAYNLDILGNYDHSETGQGASDQATNGPASVQVSDSVTGTNWNPPEQMEFISQRLRWSSAIGAQAVDDQFILESTFSFDTWGDWGECGAQDAYAGVWGGFSSISGLLEIGTTAELPDGSPASLVINAVEDFPVDPYSWNNKSWYLEIWSNDPDNPLAKLDSGTLTTSMSVLAGQTLHLDFVQKMDVWGYDCETSFLTEQMVSVNITAVPDPGSVTLALIGLAIVGWRKRSLS